MVIRSYVRSTDNHRKPCGEYIFSSIDVAVDANCSTTRTIPSANIQRQLVYDKPTSVTSFAAREKAVNLNQLTTVPLALVLKLSEQFAPSSIANPPAGGIPPNRGDVRGVVAVANHVSNREVFNSQNAIFSDQPSCQLVQEIGTEVFYFGVYSSYLKSRFISVARAFGFPAQFLLRRFKFLIQPIEMLRVCYLFSVTSANQTSNTSIDTNLFLSWRQWLNGLVIYQQRDKPASRRVEFDRHRRWLTTFVAAVSRRSTAGKCATGKIPRPKLCSMAQNI